MKQTTFILNDEGIGETVITGSVEETLAYIQSYLNECEDGDAIPLQNIRRADMTQAEIDAAPEQ